MTWILKFIFYNPFNAHPYYERIEEVKIIYGKYKRYRRKNPESIRKWCLKLSDNEVMLIYTIHKSQKYSRYESKKEDMKDGFYHDLKITNFYKVNNIIPLTYITINSPYI